MFLELRFVIGLIGMSKPGIEDFPSVVGLGPGDWMLIPHFSTLVAFFIQIHQHMQSVLHVLEIIPFIFVPPDRIKVLGGRMFSVQHINFGFLYGRMRRKIRPYKAVIPWPIKLSIGRIPTNPFPDWIYRTKASCCALSRISPVVLRKITASYFFNP